MTKKHEKINIKQLVLQSSIDMLDGDLDETINWLHSCRSDMYSNYEIETEFDENYASIRVYGFRLETDEEFDKRIGKYAEIKKCAKKAKEEKKNKELKELERLAKKYKKRII